MDDSGRFHRAVSHRALPPLVAAALTAIGATLATWPLARRLGDATLGSGEVLLTAWQLNWFHQALLTDPRAWVHANIFFPYGNAATYNDLLLTHAAATLPLAGSESPVLALNVALLGGIVLCAVFAHLLIVELTDAPWAGAVGATLFALTPFRLLHLPHLSIAASWAVPLFFWVLLRHLRRPSWGWAALAAASGVAVAASSLYHAAFVAPVIPLVLLFGAGRGPGGRRTWLPLLAFAVPGLALVLSLLTPYASSLRTVGAAAAPSDLMRYGADLTSLAQRPPFLEATEVTSGINPEARLYPGLALALLALAGALWAVASGRPGPGWRRHAYGVFLALVMVEGLGLLFPPGGLIGEGWRLLALGAIWLLPLLAIVWAIRATSPRTASGPELAIRLGIAGALVSFVLALGPVAHHLTDTIGPAPYAILAAAHSAFEGTRVPARFGGLVVLFLALVASGALAGLARSWGGKGRLAAVCAGSLALAAVFAELPVPPLPQGRGLNLLPELRHEAYDWIRDRPGRFGMLELPDWPTGHETHWRYRNWRALRYMLASKQHGQHLANGNGRAEPFLWRRFRRHPLWSDEFFAFVTAYLPVRYVLVHGEGIPPESRDAAWARLERGTSGWTEVFRAGLTRIYTVDRSSGQGEFVDRLFLRRDLAPRAAVTFAVRASGEGPDGAEGPQTLELLRDEEPVHSWALDSEWRVHRVRVPVDATAVQPDAQWPRTTVRFSWRVGEEAGTPFEVRELSVERADEPR